MPSTVTLGSEFWSVVVAPDPGAGLVEASARIGDRFVPVTRPTPASAKISSEFASFVLAPYSNRIRDGRFTFDGRSYELRNAAKHAIHGDVRDRPWRLAEQCSSRVVFEWDSRWCDDANFPFPFATRVEYGCVDEVFTTSLTVKNVGTEPMPAGGGFHPYFRRDPLGIGDDVSLAFQAGGLYPTGDVPIPSGPAAPLTPESDFSKTRPLPFGLDVVYADWSGRATLRWPRSGFSLEVTGGGLVRHLVVYSPEVDFFAVEPVANATDGFNLMARGFANTGVFILAPGESKELRMKWRLRVLGTG